MLPEGDEKIRSINQEKLKGGEGHGTCMASLIGSHYIGSFPTVPRVIFVPNPSTKGGVGGYTRAIATIRNAVSKLKKNERAVISLSYFISSKHGIQVGDPLAKMLYSVM